MTSKFLCSFCNKNFSSNQRLKTHYNCCKSKKEKNNENDKIEELENINKKLTEKLEQKNEEIAFLKTLLETCVKKPTIQNNNIQNNIQNLMVQLEPIDFEDIKHNLHNFDNYKQRCGLQGFAEFLCQDVFNGKIILTDHARDIFRYNTLQKKDVKDPKGTFLLNESIRQAPNELLKKFETAKEILEENELNEEKINKTKSAIQLIRKIKNNIAVSDGDFANVVRTNAIDNMNQKVFLQK